jgi:hypothetical protein
MLRRLRPDTLMLAHYGAITNVEQHLTSLQDRLYHWGDFVLNALKEGKTAEEITSLLIKDSNPELEHISRSFHDVVRYDIATNYPMTVMGYIRYWQTRHPERLT